MLTPRFPELDGGSVRVFQGASLMSGWCTAFPAREKVGWLAVGCWWGDVPEA